MGQIVVITCAAMVLVDTIGLVVAMTPVIVILVVAIALVVLTK